MLQKLLLIVLCIPACLGAQKSRPFTITGHSDYYNDSDLVVIVGNYPIYSRYNDATLSHIKKDTPYTPFNHVVNGRFELAGTVRYPHPLILSFYDRTHNEGRTARVYFIDGGDVDLTVDDLRKNRNLPSNIANSRLNTEYGQLRKLYLATIDTVANRPRDMKAKQAIMNAYIKAHPDSYVALWDLAFDYFSLPKDEEKKSILANLQLFSPALRRTHTWRALAGDLQQDLALTVGKTFPELSLQPALSIKIWATQNKYTFVDFWFSHCHPCLEQMPALKKIYAANKKELSIIGISVDQKKYEADWREAIEKYRLDWPQYWDAEGKEASRIRVNSFPSNFLLDRKGMIIKKDLSPEELEEFLQKDTHK